MRWSLRVGTFFGIPVFLHGTFFVLLVFLFLHDWSTGGDLRAAVAGVLFLLAIFGTVVLHELGHALAARRFGIRTRDITLLPIGGVARLERIPTVPRQELWVALAGPAVNVAIALAGSALVLAVAGGSPAIDVSDATSGFAGRFIGVNIWLALFNLIPAFPMDGGRALRALLAERFDYARATEIAASLGQALALVFGCVGLFSNPVLVFIALFVWMGATAEASSVSVRSSLTGIPVGRAMITNFDVVDAASPLRAAADSVIAGSQHDFPALEHGRLVGVLTRDALVKAIATNGLDSAVRDAMNGTFAVASPDEMLEEAFARLQASGCPVLPVVHEQRLVGLLTAENVSELVMLRTAAGRHVSRA